MSVLSRLPIFAVLVAFGLAAPLAHALHDHDEGVEAHCDACHACDPVADPKRVRVAPMAALPIPACGIQGVPPADPPAPARKSRGPPR